MKELAAAGEKVLCRAIVMNKFPDRQEVEVILEDYSHRCVASFGDTAEAKVASRVLVTPERAEPYAKTMHWRVLGRDELNPTPSSRVEEDKDQDKDGQVLA